MVRPPLKIPYCTIAALLAVVVMFSVAAAYGDEWSGLAYAVAVVLLNLGFWAAFWSDYWKPLVKRLDAQKRGLEKLESAYRNLSGNVEGYQTVIERMQTSVAVLPEHGKGIDDLKAELDRRFSPPSKPVARLPVASPASVPPAPALLESEPAFPAAPVTAGAAVPAEWPSDFPVHSPADLAREKLGALFVQEIRTAPGADAAAVWDRYLARLPAPFQNLPQQPVHWDRDGLSLCFHAQSSGAYKDTGKCWLVQAGEQALLFFPALAAATARKEDLPGCQIQAHDIVLRAGSLARFIPPVVARTPDGWAIQSEGSVEYR